MAKPKLTPTEREIRGLEAQVASAATSLSLLKIKAQELERQLQVERNLTDNTQRNYERRSKEYENLLRDYRLLAVFCVQSLMAAEDHEEQWSRDS